MLLTIHNLPHHTRYADVKKLILSKCGFKEVILDNLVNEGRDKKVTVGLAEEEDAAILVRQINGLFFEGRQLYVQDVRQKKLSEQPYRQTNRNYDDMDVESTSEMHSNQQYNNYGQQPTYSQQMNTMAAQQQYSNQVSGYQTDNSFQANQQPVHTEQVMQMMMPFMGAMNMANMTNMYYVPQQAQTSYTDFNNQAQMQQFQSASNQYSQFFGQLGQIGSESQPNPKEDKWSRDRQNQWIGSQDDKDTGYSHQSTYKSDTRQSGDRWERDSDIAESRRRSRSPVRKRDRSRDRSRISPKRPKRDRDYTNRDSSRHTGSRSNRDSQRLPSDRNETFTSQTYGNSAYNYPYASQTYENSANDTSHSSQTFRNSGNSNPYASQTFGNSGDSNPYASQPYGNSSNSNMYTSQTYGNSGNNNSYTSQNYGNSDQSKSYDSKSYNERDDKSYYSNKPVTRPSANEKPKALLDLPIQNPWDNMINNPPFKQEAENQFDRSAPFKDEAKVSIWNDNDSYDPLSNFRKHMQSKSQSKSWSNTADVSRDRKDTAPYGSEQRSQNTWWNSDHRKNDTKSKPWSERDNTSSNDKPIPGKNRPDPPLKKPWKRPSSDRNVHKGDTSNNRDSFDKPKKNKRKQPGRMMPTIKRDSANRFKASGQIAYEMSVAYPDLRIPGYHKHLKKAVRSRLEILLAEKLGESIPEMVSIYRAKFPATQDRKFCELIAKEVQDQAKTVVDLTGPDVKTEVKSENQNLADNKTQPKAGGSQQPRVKQPTVPQLKNPDGKLPKYPNADKQVYKDAKKLKKLEHEQEDLYPLPTHLHDALEEELKNFTDIFKSVLTKPDNVKEKPYCNRFLKVGLDHMRKIVKLNVTKRLLNITTNLIIRVFVSGKPPKKTDVELFLRKLKVVSLKKSDRAKLTYVATCNDFETYDHLLAMESTPLDQDTILKFKPFQLAGPKLSFRERKRLREERFQNPDDTTDDLTNDDEYLDLGNDGLFNQAEENIANDVPTVEECQDSTNDVQDVANDERVNVQGDDKESKDQDGDKESKDQDDDKGSKDQDGEKAFKDHDDQDKVFDVVDDADLENVELNEDDFEDY